MCAAHGARPSFCNPPPPCPLWGVWRSHCSVNLVTARVHSRDLCGNNLHNVLLTAVSPLRRKAVHFGCLWPRITTVPGLVIVPRWQSKLVRTWPDPSQITKGQTCSANILIWLFKTAHDPPPVAAHCIWSVWYCWRCRSFHLRDWIFVEVKWNPPEPPLKFEKLVRRLSDLGVGAYNHKRLVCMCEQTFSS